MKIDWSNTADLVTGILILIIILSGLTYFVLLGVRGYQKKQLKDSPVEQAAYETYVKKSDQNAAELERRTKAIDYNDPDEIKKYEGILNDYLAKQDKISAKYDAVIYRNRPLDKAIDITSMLAGGLLIFVFFWVLGRESFSEVY